MCMLTTMLPLQALAESAPMVISAEEGTTVTVQDGEIVSVTTDPEPTAEPTAQPTEGPTAEPTAEPTAAPSAEPSAAPTGEPTAEPTEAPTAEPTAAFRVRDPPR